ncbi:MAG: transporter substrate-binding domain-containing protein [Chromatiales bacterium]|nr:transporter substrate-binding domain-containing protein [Chromatiales bacterium]
MARSLIALLLVLLSTVSTAADELKVGVMHFPPYYKIDKYGGTSGTYVELIDKVLKRAGLKYSFRGYPNARFYQYLKSGEFNLFFGSTKGNKEIEPYLIYSKKPLKDAIELRIYTRRGNSIEKIEKVADLYGKNIITIHGFRYSGMLKQLETAENKPNIYTAKSHKAGLQMLKAGRADYLLDYKVTTEKHIKEIGADNFDYEVTLSIPIYIMIHKDYPNAAETLKKIEQNYWAFIAEQK